MAEAAPQQPTKKRAYKLPAEAAELRIAMMDNLATSSLSDETLAAENEVRQAMLTCGEKIMNAIRKLPRRDEGQLIAGLQHMLQSQTMLFTAIAAHDLTEPKV